VRSQAIASNTHHTVTISCLTGLSSSSSLMHCIVKEEVLCNGTCIYIPSQTEVRNRHRHARSLSQSPQEPASIACLQLTEDQPRITFPILLIHCLLLSRMQILFRQRLVLRNTLACARNCFLPLICEKEKLAETAGADAKTGLRRHLLQGRKTRPNKWLARSEPSVNT